MHDAPAFLGLEVERQAAFVAIHPEEGRSLSVQPRIGRRVVAEFVAALGALDLDHVGAAVRQDQRGERPGHEVREVQHPEALQRRAGARGPGFGQGQLAEQFGACHGGHRKFSMWHVSLPVQAAFTPYSGPSW